ncbi:fibronectin type III domain-containing protein [Curvibacter sp. RS43]|uniref:fibronectin type III domain-containing protein n=1 Tax=Curvibacter microcysteis TaxID=3026419 RepID=UPI00235E6807|nr:fibronectin type III domain-containing protein [Curvibacter sp. RS43]MDD0812379.1 fibronectin type III domain-containing protein [Curvibacter sp. RS43]
MQAVALPSRFFVLFVNILLNFFPRYSGWRSLTDARIGVKTAWLTWLMLFSMAVSSLAHAAAPPTSCTINITNTGASSYTYNYTNQDLTNCDPGVHGMGSGGGVFTDSNGNTGAVGTNAGGNFLPNNAMTMNYNGFIYTPPSTGYNGDDTVVIYYQDQFTAEFGQVTLTLHVTGGATAPGAPTSVSATPGNASASVSFTAPGSNGGATITGYTVTASPGGSTTTGAVSPINVTGLTNGTAYTFTVKATNSAGTGVASAASSAVTPRTVPGAPSGVSATAASTTASVSFTAPASNGGATITGYTVTVVETGATFVGASSPISVTGLTNGTAYTFTVKATNVAGTGTASAASTAVTPKTAQTITFNNPGTQNFGTTPTLSASASSTLPVFFTSATTGVCTVSGSTLTFVTAGNCTINANQGGNSTIYAAPQVQQTFTVNAIVPGAPAAPTATAGDTTASVSFTAPGSNGGAAITGYTVTVVEIGATFVGASSPISVTGLTNGTAYTFTVKATNSVGTGTASAASTVVTPKAAQTITFNNPGSQNFGTTPTLSASASSALPVVFTSATTGVCTVSGTALTLVAAGTCTISANQAGDAAFGAATQVQQTFAIAAVVPGVPTAASATAGNTSATVAFTAPAFTGGAAITGYTVTVSPGGATFNGAASPINVTGLTNGTVYTFTVKATNIAGSGLASTATSAVAPSTVPGAPTGVVGTAGDGRVTVAFTAPASDGGGAITAYTVTASPGGATANGAASPLVVTGLTNGTAYTFTVTATNQAGTSAASTASAAVTPRLLTVSTPVPGMAGAGAATATLSGGGASCTLNPTSGFGTVSHPATSDKPMPYGEYAFESTSCAGTVTMTITYPRALPAEVQFWKYGPATAAVGGVVAASTWFQLSGVNLSGDRKTVTYSITDNGPGDSDAAVGSIRDPFAPVVVAGANDPTAIPVDAPWALVPLAIMLGLLGVRSQRRQARQ